MLPEYQDRFFNQVKERRIEYLRQRGFNVPKHVASLRSLKEVAVFCRDHKEKRFSFRTQRTDPNQDFGTPYHFPNMEIGGENTKKLCKAVRNGFEILVYEAIDPEEAMDKGNVWFDKLSSKIVIESKEGPGTVREIEKGGIKVQEFNTSKMDVEEAKLFGYPLKSFLDIPFDSFIIEFSKYRIPVGTKNDNFIFWEIRRG